jgi:hypothetical protein
LLEPVRRALQGATELLIVTNGALTQLPFGLLVTKPIELPPERADQLTFSAYKKVPWLARDVAVTQVPSIAALIALREFPRSASERQAFVGLGDPWFSAQQAAANVSPAERVMRGAWKRRHC